MSLQLKKKKKIFLNNKAEADATATQSSHLFQIQGLNIEIER